MKFDRDTVQDPTYKVTLDGRELEYCIAADEEKGTAKIVETDWRTGDLVKDGSEFGYRCIEMKGNVKITKIKADPPKEEPSHSYCGDYPWDPCGYPGGYSNPLREETDRWVCGVKLGPTNAPPIEFQIDESLPPLGEMPDRHYMEIARGRIVKAKVLEADKPTKNGTLYTMSAVQNAYDPGRVRIRMECEE